MLKHTFEHVFYSIPINSSPYGSCRGEDDDVVVYNCDVVLRDMIECEVDDTSDLL